MLSLLLILLPDPSASPNPVPTPDPEVRLRLLDSLAGSRCGEPGFVRVERPSGQPGLLRNDVHRDGEVRRYLLLDRTIRGCPAPISYALPEQPDGFIRNLGRPPLATPAPGRVQPRSSE